jgi:hypothetical protein
MDNINIILFAIGFVVAIITLIIMLVKTIKGNKVGFLLPFILIIGMSSIGSGVWLTIQQNNQSNTKSTTAQSNSNSTATNKDEANVSTETKQTQKEVVFDANGSVVPKITEDEWSRKIITDADGSKTILEGEGKSYINIAADGTRFFTPASSQGVVQIPQNQSTADGKVYKQYNFFRDSILLKITMTESNQAVPNETKIDSKDLPSNKDKREDYEITNSNDMRLIDFIYKVMPDVKPKNTIANNFLNGTYVGKEEKILDNQTIMSMEIIDDKLLKISSKYISNISDKTYGYKLELLGKNAYKLYLYPTIKDEKGFFITDKSSKRTFLVYMKCKDSFDIVFIDDNVNRVSVNMNKQ